jgi:hypothetical protein
MHALKDSLILILASFLLFGLSLSSGTAEDVGIPQLPPELVNDPYVEGFVDILSKWNDGSLQLPDKKDLRDNFEALLESKLKERPFGYETQEWANERRAKFEALPEQVFPKLPLDKDAAAELLALCSVNLPSLKRKIADPKNLLQEVPLAIYIVMSESQERALKEGGKAIAPIYVSESVFDWWTNVYPFCPTDESPCSK